MNTLTRFILLTLTILAVVSCEVSSDGSDGTGTPRDPSYDEKSYFANTVKLISPAITNARDSSTMLQSKYALDEQRRLLISLGNMGNRSNRSVVDKDNKMYLIISSDDFIGNKSTFEMDVKICPITKKWMMLATWTNAHPYPTDSPKWETPGGDFDEASCMTADTSVTDSGEDQLYFDISDWYTYYILSHGKNFGLMVTTETPFVLYGNTHTSKAPIFRWKIRVD